MQKELESQRQEHELKLFQLQREKEEERKRTDENRKLLDKIPCLTDSDQPEAYLARFEDLVKDAKIPKEDWCRRLRPLLTGKALNAYSRDIPEAVKQDYDKLKEALLNALGLTLPQCIEEFFRAEKRSSLSIQEAIRSAEFALNRVIRDCQTKDEVLQMLLISRLYTWCSPECASYIRLHKPTTVGEATTIATEYIRTHRNDGAASGGSRAQREDRWRSDERRGQYRTSGYEGNGGRKSPNFVSQQRGKHNNDWQPTCFLCGIRGHKANECPNKNKYKENKDEKAQVRRVVIPNPLPPQVVQGKIGYHCCSMLLDSGADITVVDSKFVNPKQYTKSHITVTGVHGESQSRQLAEVWVHVG